MIRAFSTLIRLAKPNYQIFQWMKQSKKEAIDDSAYDPANWTGLQSVVDNIKKVNENKPKLLPIKKKELGDKLTVVMEVDEVLWYSFIPDQKEMFLNAPLRQYDYYVDLPEFNNFVNVYKREHLDGFMNYLLNETEPVIWSKAQRGYVEKVMDVVCPKFPKESIFCQEECNLVEEDEIEDYFKDFDRLGRDRKRTVYIDAKPLSFWTFGDNSIPVSLFVADNTDTKNDLILLVNLLDSLKSEPDVRTALKSKFKIQDTLKEAKFID